MGLTKNTMISGSGQTSTTDNIAVTNGLISYYKFATLGTFADDSYGSNNLTNNGATFTTDGTRGGVASFDGVNDYFSGAPTSNKTGEGSWVMWFNSDNIAVGLLSLFGANSGSSQVRPAGVSSFRVATSTSGNQTFNTGTMSSSTWYMLSLTRDSSNDVRLYLDTTESSTGAINMTGDFELGKIGARDVAPSNFWDGLMDNVRYHNIALSSAQITQIYNAELL